MASGIKREHEPPPIVGDLLQSEIAEKQARSIKYQITVAKLPPAKDITTSTSPTRRSTKSSCASLQKEPSSPSSTISFWSAEPARGSRICPSRSHALIRNGARGPATTPIDNPAGYETIADVPERLPKFIDEIYNAERLHSHLAMR
jgi:hypothetical protein